jgi:hypothetical protein
MSNGKEMAKTDEIDRLQGLIYEVCGHKVMLDSDLAGLYEVPVKTLNRAVKRNIGRFPPDFMFQLTESEWEILRCQIGTLSLRCQIGTSSLRSQIETTNLRSQIVTLESSHGKHRKYMPYVFTEHGVLMLSSVLNSQRAIEMNVLIMRAFVQMRQFLQRQVSTHDEVRELKRILLLYMDKTDARLDAHDDRINQIIHVLNNLIENPKPAKRIGFSNQ